MKSMKSQMVVALVSLLLWGVSFLDAGIVNDGDVTTANPFSTAVGTAYEDAGMQYVGTWGSATAVIVSPTQILTARHYGSTINASNMSFTFGGQSYSVKDSSIDSVDDMNGADGKGVSDLRLVTLEGANFSAAQIAPIYEGSISGNTAVVTGNGYSAGTAITGGWEPSATQKSLQWGTNVLDTSIEINGEPTIGWDFDNTGKTDYEMGLADMDSGGGVFVEDGGTWKLAGTNSYILVMTSKNSTGDFTAYQGSLLSFEDDGTGKFTAGGIYDADGLNVYDNDLDMTGTLIDDSSSETTSGWSFASDLTAADNKAWLDYYIDPEPAPEPATMVLLAMGGVAMLRRRRK